MSWQKPNVGSADTPVPEVHAESISSESATIDGKPWHDVTAYGAVGDGSTDDSDAIQAAADAAAPDGVLYIPPGYNCAIENQVDIDLGQSDAEINDEDPNEVTPFKIVCQGSIKPASGIKAIHVHHGTQPQLFVQVDGGGGSPESDAALFVTDLVAPQISAIGRNYGGTVVEADSGNSKLVNAKYEHLFSVRCGQTLWAKNHTGMGKVEYLWENRPQYCSHFANTGDLTIGLIENYVPSSTTDRGMMFDDGGNAVWIDSIEVGGSVEDPLLTFKGINQIVADNIYALNGDDVGVVFDSCSNVKATVTAKNNAGGGVVLTETLSDTTDKIVLDITADSCGSNGVDIEQSVSGRYIRLDGVSAFNASSGVAIGSESPDVLVNKMFLDGNGSEDLFVTSNGKAHILDAKVGSVVGTLTTDRQL